MIHCIVLHVNAGPKFQRKGFPDRTARNDLCKQRVCEVRAELAESPYEREPSSLRVYAKEREPSSPKVCTRGSYAHRENMGEAEIARYERKESRAPCDKVWDCGPE